MNVTIQGASTSIAGGHFAIIGENGEQIAAVKAIETLTARTAGSSYDAHRMAKGDMYDSSVEYVVDGDIEGVCRAIADNLPQCFKDAKIGVSSYKRAAGDFYNVFSFLRSLNAQAGWYGNTPAPIVKKIKAAYKKGVQFSI